VATSVESGDKRLQLVAVLRTRYIEAGAIGINNGIPQHRGQRPSQRRNAVGSGARGHELGPDQQVLAIDHLHHLAILWRIDE